MASSSYWKSMYNSEKEKVNKYADWLDDLDDIIDGFKAYSVTNGVSSFNKKVEKTVNDLEDAVKNQNTYRNNVGDIENEKEKKVDADSKLVSAKNYVQQEINRVKRLKSEAEDRRDDYWDKYKAAKRREAAEAARRAAEAAAKAVSGS